MAGRPPIYWAHRVVFFAIAQLSCLVCSRKPWLAAIGHPKPLSPKPQLKPASQP